MTFTDAAREVLRLEARPLHYKEITELAIDKNLLSHVGKSPEVTMGARLAATLKKGGDDNPLIRVKPGVFALRDWDEDTIKQGLLIKRPTSKKKAVAKDGAAAKTEKKAAASKRSAAPKESKTEQDAPAAEASSQGNAKASEAPEPTAPVVSELPAGPDEALRAEMAAGARSVFAAEDDDDQPILKPVEEDSEPAEGRRRRRRRRRRGGRGNKEEQGDSSGLPSYTAKPVASGEGSGRSAQVIDVAPREVPVLDGLVGRPLADGIEIILTSFERSAGAVSLRQIVDVAQRRNKLTGDVQLAQSQIAASVRADNAQRRAAGVRPRFRLAGGRVGLTEWLLDQDLARAEAELKSALARYRETAQRAFARKCNELPGHAFVELCATLLARLGAHELKQVRFPGASGAEIHFTARINSPAGVLGERAGTSAGLKLGIVIRKDGRDMGRERLTEFRGAAHHYDGAQLGWIMSAGQVLSGARDEANVDGALPVTLLDGLSIARLCEQYDVAVLRASNPVAIADVDFFEALRSS